MSADLLQLQYGNRVCHACNGDGWLTDAFDECQDCGLCEGTGELGEHSNHNVDLRPYMTSREFAEHLERLFPTQNNLPVPVLAEINPKTPPLNAGCKEGQARESITAGKDVPDTSRAETLWDSESRGGQSLQETSTKELTSLTDVLGHLYKHFQLRKP